MIEIIGTALTQWDTGRVVEVTGTEADHVHFANHGDSKAVIMGIADSQAKIPDYLLQTGKQLCVYAVKNGITLESKTFYVKHRERPENYVYEEDRRNYIYELISSAETAVENANHAVEGATQAAAGANTASASANLATENAIKSADSANLAAKNANDAADKANHTAKSLMVVGSTEGESIHLDDAIDQFLVGLRVFGKTTQDGTPTPDAPVELESVENPTVTVNDQTLLVPYTLRGVPVTSGGNYTDANGQQWICDEVDFARGVYVKRVDLKEITQDARFTISPYGDAGYYRFVITDVDSAIGNQVPCMCSHFERKYEWEQNRVYTYVTGDGPSKAYLFSNMWTSASAFTTWLKEQKDNGTPLIYVYQIGEPVETPLSAEELAAYASLRTYRGNTTVSNDASAHMAIEYVMDAKTYISRLITGISSPGRVVNVSLPASKWAGSGNLFSQVVTIDGITENSQVNLTPSVEQLSIFYEKDVTFITENDGGTVTVYVLGQKPTNDYTIKASVVEVIA